MIRKTLLSFSIIALMIYGSSEHFADKVITLINKVTKTYPIQP